MDETTSRLLSLLDEHGLRLHALLARIAVRKDVADELLQELFLKVRAADGFAKATHPERYLFRAAINLAFDWRRLNRWSPSTLSGDETCSGTSPMEQAIRREELERVMAAVEALAPADRELVVLRFLNGNSFEELAERLESTPHRVRALCSKAVARVRSRLEPNHTIEVSDVDESD